MNQVTQYPALTQHPFSDCSTALDKLKGASISKGPGPPKEEFRSLQVSEYNKTGGNQTFDDDDDDDDDDGRSNRAKVHNAPSPGDTGAIKSKPSPKNCCTIS